MMESRSIDGSLAMAVCLVAVAVLAAPALASTGPTNGEVTGSTAADHADPAPPFAVAVQPDGTAEVHVTYAFDLAEESRADAFTELQGNESAALAFEDRFSQRLHRVAADAAAATDREMRIEDVDLTLRTAENTGIAEFSFTWQGLAAVDGDRLFVTEPFASGFAPDRPVHLRAPDGYAVADATPSPTTDDGARVTWEAGTDLSGFEVVLEPAEGEGTDGSNGEADGGTGPGFGLFVAVLGVVAALVVAVRRR